MSKHFRTAGIAASVILVLFGAASIAMGLAGRHTVTSNLAAEKIVGTPDMTPAKIKAEAAAAGLKNVDLPTCSVAGQAVDNGGAARCFSQYMRIHALEATGGQVYAEMGRYVDKAGKPTNDAKLAATDPKSGQPVENPMRNVWINETALGTALNTSYFATNVALFAIVMGVALLLTGIGFLVLTLGLIRTAPEGKETEVTLGAPVLAG